MRLVILAECLLLMLILISAVTTHVDAARSFRRSSYRSYQSYSSYRSYSGSYYYNTGRLYRSPLYTRRLSSSLMGALYFSYVTRYPRHFSYRRVVIGSSGSTCTNYMALNNGSYIGTFTCPFLSDEPSSWIKCCGYATEQFCCDPAYDDSWRLGRGLSVIAIVFIVGGCLVGLAIIGFLVFSLVKKGTFAANRGGVTVTSAVVTTSVSTSGPAAAAASAGNSTGLQTYQPPVHVLSKTTIDGGQQQVAGSIPLPYPTFDGGPPTGSYNQGFEPPPYPMYPPPYQSPEAGYFPPVQH